jgi:hypothetical protein
LHYADEFSRQNGFTPVFFSFSPLHIARPFLSANEQLQTERAPLLGIMSASDARRPKYHGLLQAFRLIVKEEGLSVSSALYSNRRDVSQG